MTKYETWAILIAATALLQPWLILFWKRFVRRSYVEFYETGKIELGFSELGPTLSLIGTCRAINGDVFVREVSVIVKKLKNKSQHDFSVLAFRSKGLTADNMTPINFEIPAGFLVRPDNPVPIYPVLNDKQVQRDIAEEKEKHSRELYNFQEKYFSQVVNVEGAEVARSIDSDVDRQAFVEQAYKERFDTEFYTKVGREFYWDAGEYSLAVILKSTNASNEYSKEYKFSISEEDSDSLRMNVIRIVNLQVNTFLGKPNVVWQFINCDYSA